MSWQENNVLRLQLVAIGVVLIAPVAVTAGEYYVERVPHSQACTVTEKKPDGKKTIAVGGVHKTKAEAEASMSENPDCGY